LPTLLESGLDQKAKLEIFVAQTANVRALETAWAHINRQINALILQRQHKSVEVATKFLALNYCALAEAIFSKLLHTPHGLELAEIEQVKAAAAAEGVKEGWLRCAELAARRIDGSKRGHSQNVLQRVKGLVKSFIFDPSLVRNKLAHGQWAVALNRENTALNSELTRSIEDLTVVELYRRKHALEHLSSILEDIIESPNRAHRRDYWTHLTRLEEAQMKLSKWTVQAKMEQLFRKKSYARLKSV
jgi:hypothetical protein